MKYAQGWELPFQTESGLGLREVEVLIGDREKKTPLMVAVLNQNEAVVVKLASQSEIKSNPLVTPALRL